MSESKSKQVQKYLKTFPEISYDEVKDFIPGLTYDNFNMITSRYRKKLREQGEINNILTKPNNKKKSNDYTKKKSKLGFHDPSGKKGINKITMENVEESILTAYRNNPNSVPVLRLVVDFLKIKSQDHSELKEIDLDKFYKIALDEDDNNDDSEIISDIS